MKSVWLLFWLSLAIVNDCDEWSLHGLITRRSPVQVWLAPFPQPKQSQALKRLVLDEKVILN